MSTTARSTTVGNTKLDCSSGPPIYAERDRNLAVQSAQMISSLRRALAALPRTCSEFTYLRERIQAHRSNMRTYLARSLPITTRSLSYRGQSCIVSAIAKELRPHWLALRDRTRAEVRNRRHNLREVMANRWCGFMRGDGVDRYRVTGSTYRYGLTLTTRCGVHLEPNTIRLAYVAKLKQQLFQSKAPRENDTRRWVSVEIECILGTT